jgi:hypothetical protein
MIKNTLTIIALSLLGLCLFVGLAKNAKNSSTKHKKWCDIICSISVFSAVVLIAVVQLLGEEKKSNFELQDSSGGGEAEVIFYSMGASCGHCKNAENNTLKHEIATGKVKVVPSSEAPKKYGFRGFPSFVSNRTGKTSTGAPKSYKALLVKLEN